MARRRGGQSENRVERLLAYLRERFPAIEDNLPLMRGVERELTHYLPNESSWRVIAALRRHVARPDYLRAVGEGEMRHTLFGDPVEEISEAERAFALANLHDAENAGAGSQDPQAFFCGVRAVLLHQVALRFDAATRERTTELLDAPIPPEGVRRLAGYLLECDGPEAWLTVVATETSERVS